VIFLNLNGLPFFVQKLNGVQYFAKRGKIDFFNVSAIKVNVNEYR